MKTDFIQFIGNARQHKSANFRNQLSIFLICLVLSLLIWFLVRLSKDYYYAMEYHLTYTNIPAKLKLNATSDTILTVKIKVQGFDFITERFIIPHERRFDVSLQNIRVRYTDNRVWGYLLTNRIGKDLVAQSSFSGDVYFVTPDTLFFEFEKREITPADKKPEIKPGSAQPLGKDSLTGFPDSLKKTKKIVPGHQEK